MTVRRQPVTVLTETSVGGPLGWMRAIDFPEWMAEAACVGIDPDTWFPTVGSGRYNSGHRRQQATAAAKAICRACPVKTQCLEYALELGQQHGVWGGLDEHERVQLKARAGRRS